MTLIPRFKRMLLQLYPGTPSAFFILLLTLVISQLCRRMLYSLWSSSMNIIISLTVIALSASCSLLAKWWRGSRKNTSLTIWFRTIQSQQYNMEVMLHKPGHYRPWFNWGLRPRSHFGNALPWLLHGVWLTSPRITVSKSFGLRKQRKTPSLDCQLYHRQEFSS